MKYTKISIIVNEVYVDGRNMAQCYDLPAKIAQCCELSRNRPVGLTKELWVQIPARIL